MKKRAFLLSAIAMMVLLIVSCKKTPAPTAEIFATIDGYTVTFSAKVTDVDSYLWDFGDGQTSTEANPVHTYSVSGSYTVTLVVKGEGGQATVYKDITIEASFAEMLTGGPSAPNGKTWVLSSTLTAGQDGAGPVDPEMQIDVPSEALELALNEISEYDNEFTFYDDGTYSINPVNDTVLAGAVYGIVSGTILDKIEYNIGLCNASFTALEGATWELHNTDLTVDAITNQYETTIPPEHSDKTFSGKSWISLSEGAYFGILDFPTTAQFIIKEITPTEMHVALFLCGYAFGDNFDDMALPSSLIHLTYVPKSSK